MTRIISILPIFLIFLVQLGMSSVARRTIVLELGKTLEIPFFKTPETVKRYVTNEKKEEVAHIFTLCNGKNEGECGYWADSETKKDIGRDTSYDKNKDVLIIPKATVADVGSYSARSYEIISVEVIES